MIIVRSPLRISLGGGGTDFSSYYEKYGGELIAASIDKYVYVTITRPFSKGIFLKYSEHETINTLNQIRHPIIRETLKLLSPAMDQIEITTLADIPAGTGLGSSGSFTTALISALHAYNGHYIEKTNLAELACEIEINKLKQPIGKQDQYIASFGGLNHFKFEKNGLVETSPLSLSKDMIYELEENLLLFFTGYSREASSILIDQDNRSKLNDTEILKNLHFTKELGQKSRNALEKGDFQELGILMNEHWKHKKTRSKGMSNKIIDNWYKIALKNGAVGGKLVGAGGGGFLMFVCKDKVKLRRKMVKNGLEEVRFRFDYEGTKIMYRS